MIDAKEEAPAAEATWGQTQPTEVQSGLAGLKAHLPRSADQVPGAAGRAATAVAGVMASGPDPIWSAIRGCQAAQEAIAEVRTGYASPDALFDALQAVLVDGDVDGLRAFARRLQKAVEQYR